MCGMFYKKLNTLSRFYEKFYSRNAVLMERYCKARAAVSTVNVIYDYDY